MGEQEKHKEIVVGFVEEAHCRANLDAVDEFLAEDFVDHSAFLSLLPTRAGVKQLFGALWAAFPD